jgi:hypothetical protein
MALSGDGVPSPGGRPWSLERSGREGRGEGELPAGVDPTPFGLYAPSGAPRGQTAKGGPRAPTPFGVLTPLQVPGRAR